MYNTISCIAIVLLFYNVELLISAKVEEKNQYAITMMRKKQDISNFYKIGKDSKLYINPLCLILAIQVRLDPSLH